jgi:hypothetical protein
MTANSLPDIVAVSGIQFVVGTTGEPSGVLLDMATWRRIVQALEDSEDSSIAKQALAEIDAAGGNLEIAGFLSWENLRSPTSI